MPYKIAIASTDGTLIDVHFGMAEKFYIYSVESNGQYHLSEVRQTTASCGSKDNPDSSMQQTVDMLADCKVVLVTHIGPCAEQRLKASGILYYTLNGGIDSALSKLVEYLRKQKSKMK